MNHIQWINLSEIPLLGKDDEVVLFGAGHGSEDIIVHFRKQGLAERIVGVVDNDPSMWGKRLAEFPIFEPSVLSHGDFTKIMITSISGREDIGDQLAGMGLTEGVDFFKVGRYPQDVCGKLAEIIKYDSLLHFAGNLKTVAHVGSGGFFGFDLSLLALWVDFVFSIDAYRFNAMFPDVTEEKTEYVKCFEQLEGLALEHGFDPYRCARRWQECLEEREQRTFVNTEKTAFLHPYRFSALPLMTEQVDMVISFGVLEHVRNPERAAAESFRVLRKGGLAYHNIITRDHRSFGGISGYTPLSYRSCSQTEWERINAKKFFQNRVAPWQWRRLFLEAGFDILLYEVLHSYDPGPEEIVQFHEDFARWPSKLQREVDCVLIARKA